MKIFKTSIIYVVLTVSICLPSSLVGQEIEEAPYHEGSFIRFLLGGGPSSVDIDNEINFKSSPGGLFHFQIGGEIGGNLVLFGDFGGLTLSDPEIELRETTTIATDASRNSFEHTSKGNFLIEVNTGFSEIGFTGIYAYVIDDVIYYSLGADMGYFIMDDVAVRLGLYYGGGGDYRGVFAYRLGGKYYINSTIPVGLDITGQSIEDYDNNPFWLGIQAGYAFFLSDKVAIEPAARWNHSLNKDWDDSGFLELNVGFTLFFK